MCLFFQVLAQVVLLQVLVACIHEVLRPASALTPPRLCSANATSILELLVLVPLPDETYRPAFDKGHSIIPAVQLAAKQINERQDILPGHCLEMIVGDSGCDQEPKTAVALVRNLLYNVSDDMQSLRERQVVGIVGPSCSEASINVVNALRRTGIVQLYSGNTPVLSNSDPQYKYSFGMISSSKVYIDALLRIAELSGWEWKNVAFLYESNRKYFRDTYRELTKRLNGSTMGYVSPVIETFFFPLADIQRKNIRIVIALTSARAARQLACLAEHLDFTYPVHQLVFTDRVLKNFLDEEVINFTLSGDKREYVCKKQQMLKSLNGSVFLTYSLDTLDQSLVTESKFTIGEVREQYQTMLEDYAATVNMSLTRNVYAYPYYDATWALALSINRSLNLIGSNELNYGYGITDVSEVIRSIIANISFQGVSVYVEFNEERHVTNNVDIFQVDDEQQMKRGYWNGRNNVIILSNERLRLFIDDEFTTEYIGIHTSLIGVGFAAMFATLIFIICLQVTNIVMKKNPAVKSNSPRLNHFIFIGSYFYIIAVMFTTVQMGFPRTIADTNSGSVVCNVIPLTMLLGHSLIISTIVAKLWRIYSIFKRTFNFQHFLRDRWLAAFILANSSLTLILYAPVLIWSPFCYKIIDTTIILNSSSTRPTNNNRVSCYNLSIPWLIVPPLVHQLLALSFAVLLAIMNRKVKHKFFQYTVCINVLVYVLAISVGFGGSMLVIIHKLNVNINVFYVLYSFILLFNVCICLILLVVRFLFL